MLVELGLVEQRYRAVLEVLDGAASVTNVARRYGVGRQTVHTWLRRYAAEGLPGLADRSSRPSNCPHQMPPAVEARVVEMRRQHPGWGPRTILSRLARAGVTRLSPLGPASTGRSSATSSSTPSDGAGGPATTSAGSARGRWSSGRWTLRSGCGYRMARAPRS